MLFRRKLARPVGALALVSAALFVASLALQGRGSVEGAARAASFLLLLPGVALLASWLSRGRTALVLAASAAGALSLVLWSLGGVVVPWSWEWTWLALSSAWWLGIWQDLHRERPRLGSFTLVLGLFAALDALATVFYDHIPFWLFAVGGLKIPLSLVWQIWLGIDLLRVRSG